MTKIGLISDTHGFLNGKVLEHFSNCDEIWHAGDFGAGVAEKLKEFAGDRPFRGVYGNIDGQDIRSVFPEQLVFMCEEVKVLMRHIGASPPKYNKEVKKELVIHQPRLFVCGHSHILKLIYDEAISCLYMNPGAAGRQGWQKVSTVIRFVIDNPMIRDCEVIELGKR